MNALSAGICRAASAVVLLATALPVPSATVESDVCVYGGTSGGVIAAVEAARAGKSVVLVEPGRHVGGMTSGGLGATDRGTAATIGGLAREFYRRVGQRYGLSEAFAFEPHVAEEVYRDLLVEAGVAVYHERQLVAVAKAGALITGATASTGDEFVARMYIDATYEGDLMAMAGVAFTVGRESAATYGEPMNGIRATTPAHQFLVAVDPYLSPGDPGSGLLPFVQPGDGGIPGDGDERVQAYNYRLCLTQVETNRVPIAPPPGYAPERYELLGRYVQARVDAGHALTLASFVNIGAMPNGKTDINNNGAFSTDAIGMNYTYPTNTPAGREAIRREHEDYIRGFLTFLATDSRVPLDVRTNLQSWGLCADEFQDTGGWPHQLYVREARRMVSDYVMTQAHCAGTAVATDSVALASYNIDSHNCQRFAASGIATNEGDVQQPPAGPFPISYRSLTPRASECENLLVPVCLSASHVAFGSIRMEPVFMMMGQSAGAAAALAIDGDVAVQDLPYGKLRLRLTAGRQVLQWGGTPSGGAIVVLDSEDAAGVTVVGTWTASASQAGYLGVNYLHDQNSGKGTKSVLYTPDLPEGGVYTVYMRWTANPNRATNVPLTLTYDGGTTNLTVNQRISNAVWVALATLPFAAGTAGGLLVENAGTDGYVIADAVEWVQALPPPPTAVEVIAWDGAASEDGLNPASFVVVRTGSTTNALTVNFALSGSATPGSDYPAPAGSMVIPPGQAAAVVTIRPVADSLPEGDESIGFDLAAGAGYEIGAYGSASAVLRDGGFGAWRGDRFTAPELADEGISGAAADPDGDVEPNLLEFFAGSDPRVAGGGGGGGIRLESGAPDWMLAWRRVAGAADLYLRVETSADLQEWAPAPFAQQIPQVSNAPPYQELRFPLGPGTALPSPQFYRVAVRQTPLVLATHPAHFFFSFDTDPAGTGVLAAAVTALDGFTGTPSATRIGTVFREAGGAASFTDFAGGTWLGSGGSTAPGHSLVFDPGSVGNECRITFSTLGLRQVRLRMDVRSAAQAGGVAPSAFTSFTYDVGGGPQPVPGAVLEVVADNAFHEWAADLSTLTALDNQPSVTLSWTFKDLSASPMESFRIDNIQVSAEPAAGP